MQHEKGTPTTPPADSVTRALEGYLAAAEAGTAPPREEFLARHPELAEDLDACLAALRFIGRAAEAPRSVPAGIPEGQPPELTPGTLGDFRLIREVGRGGMGVVYEAEQISLGRRVALKVLPFAATMDPRQMQRFHNEARAAASLDHSHIVHVHAVGCERAVHFYAMQFIEGQTLAAMIADLRRAGGHAVPTGDQPTTPHVPGQPAPASDTVPRAAASTERGRPDRAHFRRVAEWGIQAAEALDHAHQLGIVHRDVKPANLLIDGRGGLRVTDFGLAHVQSDARLTMTGDLVGTLRYMSPEQALAKRVVIDHRTDVYSLGATLYELLTLEPAFSGNDRQELLRQIAFEEPKAPRRINKAIPAELEMIALKAMEKNPAERFATAKELADDLRRFLKDEPVQAKRPGLGRRVVKWSQRHRSAVAAGVATLLLSVVVLAVSNVLIWCEKKAKDEALRKASIYQREIQDHPETLAELRGRKEAKLVDALRAMDRLLGEVEKAGPLPPVLAEQALRFYEDVLPAENLKSGVPNRSGEVSWFSENLPSWDAGPRLRWEIAWAYVHLGNLYALNDRFNKARVAYGGASALFHHFLRNFGKLDVAEELISEERPAINEEFRRAAAHWKRADSEDWYDAWSDADYREELACSPGRFVGLSSRSRPLLIDGQVFRKTSELLEGLLADDPTLEHRHRVVWHYICQGDGLREVPVGRRFITPEDCQEAGALYVCALGFAEQWEGDPDVIKQNPGMFLSDLYQVAQRFHNLNAPQEAARAWRSLVKLCVRWAADCPEVSPSRLEGGALSRLDYAKRDFRLNAARYAALAGSSASSEAADLTGAERAGFRKQALDWLRAQLGAWRRLLEKEPDKAPPKVAEEMRNWLSDFHFGGVRGPNGLANLPEAEREEWQKLWADVAATLATANEKHTERPQP